MRRALQGAVGVLLVAAAVVPLPKASAIFPALRRHSQESPAQTVIYEESSVLPEGSNRLEEMKVELALLADIATFSYYLGARSAGEGLELRGYVPNDLVRQHALEVARRSTMLTVNDALRLQSNLSMRPPLRAASILQREAAELLRKKLGEPADQMALAVRTNGLVVVAGPIDSVESKLAVSKLFRQLSGCYGVVNELTVEAIVRDGQRVVRVTRDGSMVVPPGALGLEPEQAVAAPVESSMPTPVVPAPAALAPMPSRIAPQPLPEKHPAAPTNILPLPQPVAPAPTPLMNKGEGPQQESRMPTPVPPWPNPSKASNAPDVLTAPKLPVKWGRPAMNVETQAAKLESVNAPATPAPPALSRVAVKMPTAGSLTNFASASLPPLPSPTKRTEASEESRLPTAVPPCREPLKRIGTADRLTASRLPEKSGQPTLNQVSQRKKSEPGFASATPTTPPASPQQAKLPTASPVREKPSSALTAASPSNPEKRKEAPRLPTVVSPCPEPIKMIGRSDFPTAGMPVQAKPPLQLAKRVTGDAPAAELPLPGSRVETRMPTPVASNQPAEMKKPQDPAGESKPKKAGKPIMPTFVASRVAPTPAMTWLHSGSAEEAEPKATDELKSATVLPAAVEEAQPVRVAMVDPISPSRRWPPAYAPTDKGRPGVIVFDDDPPPEPAKVRTAPALVPANLQKQVKSVCGWKAREVTVETRPEGIVLVKVKVTSMSAEDQLAHKILAIPEMTAPNVRLLMDVER